MKLADFETLKTILDDWGIIYEEGGYYEGNSIVGHWLTILETNFDTDEITEEEKILNNS